MKLQFLGAAQEVTGSCFLVEAGGARFLVDCGMHQGGREVQARNHLPCPLAACSGGLGTNAFPHPTASLP